jgi:hypothetical protein
VPLAEILDRYLPAGQSIDFLTVDVEGMDEEVLRSNDWVKYRPQLVLAEDLALRSLTSPTDATLVRLMAGYGYELFAKTVNTLFFRQSSRET